QRHVLVRRHGRDEMEALEDDADMVASEPRPGIVVERPEILARDLDAARSGAPQAPRHHHQARFAGARGADDGRNFANGDVESDAAQDIDRAGIACHVEMDVGEADDGLAGDGFVSVGRGQAGSGRESMNFRTGYGRFAAAVNSLLIAILWLSAANAQTAPIKLAILGDSLAAGYGVSPAQAIPARLEAALKKQGRNVTIINHGVSGDTTAGGLQRIDWMMADK